MQGGEEQLHPVRSVHFQSLVQVAPLVANRIRRQHAHSALGTDSADDGQQAVAVLVEHPLSHGLGHRPDNALQFPRAVRV